MKISTENTNTLATYYEDVLDYWCGRVKSARESLKSIPRWKFFTRTELPEGMSQRADGEWVKLSDVEAIVGTSLAMQAPLVCGDMFWNADDTERLHQSPDEIMGEDLEAETVVEFQQAIRLPNFFGFYLEMAYDPEFDSEPEYHYFATQEEAKSALETLLKRDTEGGQGPA